VVYEPGVLLEHIDLVIIALCGEYGEDGQVQRILEKHGVSYRGSKPMAAHSTLYKPHASQAAKASGLATPKQLLVSGQSNVDIHSLAHSIGELFGPQYVIKPTSGGAGVGVELVSTAVHLPDALYAALARGVDFVVQEYIPGRSFSCGVVEGLRGTPHYKSSVSEYLHPFTDNSATSAANQKYATPAQISDTQRETIADQAFKIHTTLGLRDYSRSDFQLGNDGQVYFLEVHALPLLSNNAAMMQGLGSIGVSQEELVRHLIS